MYVLLSLGCSKRTHPQVPILIVMWILYDATSFSVWHVLVLVMGIVYEGFGVV